MKLFHFKQRGQAIVEYALLLMIAALSATAFLSLDESLKLRVAEIATEFQSDVALVNQPPIEIDEKCDESKGINCLELSPPVAKFKAPNPNYKGRDIRIVNSSYDTDGFVEHYIWSVNGQIMKKTATEVNADGGLIVNFRNPGTYPISLIVIDNDGLVSNLYSETVTVVNRPPTVDVSVRNQSGETGNTVSVLQGCSATFYTLYEDEDLPYDVLTLRSVFRDQSGVSSTDTTVPHEFTREFQNLGTNTYTVTVTDENGASVSETATVNVIANPYGAGNCGPQANITKPRFVYTVYVDGQRITPETGTNIYLIPVGKFATVVPVVTWGSYPAHNIPLYWKYTGNTGNWATTDRTSFPYPAPPNTFQPGDRDIPVEGMARDRSATSATPDPNLAGMSNIDRIILRPSGSVSGEVPVAKITFKATARVFNKNTVTTSTTPSEAALTSVDVSRVVMSVASTNSVAPPRQTIKGVRWTLPDGTVRPRAGENGAISITDSKGVTAWWYQGKLNSSDTVQGDRTFTFVSGRANTYEYKLEVITDQGVRSNVVTKTLKLDVKPNAKPNAVCSPNETVSINAGQTIQGRFNASKSSDSDDSKSALRAQWAQLSSQLDDAQSVSLSSAAPPWKYNVVGTRYIYLKVTDSKGASDVTRCTINVVGPDPYEFFVEFWYFNETGGKRRIARSNHDIVVSNRTTDYNKDTKRFGDIRHVYETIFTARADVGAWTGPIRSIPEIEGVDIRLPSTVSNKVDHNDDIVINTNNRQATFVVTLYVTDADGKVQTCYNYGSSPTNELGGTKTYCKKPTRYFRTAEETRRQAGQSCTYYTVKNTLTTIDQYMLAWNDSLSGVHDGDSLEQIMRNELRCR